MTMKPCLTLSRSGAIATLTLDHPESRNALTGNSMVDEMLQALGELQRDDSVAVLVITATGNVFSSGGNVKDMLKYERDKPALDQVRREYLNGIQRLPKALWQIDIPTIAAVNGPAIGAGLDLACMCDIRIAADRATFAESFAKVGLIPGDGGAWLLRRAVGRAKAAEMTYTGDAIDAAEALRCGLVSRVVPAGELAAEAQQLARRIAANPSSVLRMAKRLVKESELNGLDHVLELSAAMQAIAHTHPDHHEAVRAFVEKRPPQFSSNTTRRDS